MQFRVRALDTALQMHELVLEAPHEADAWEQARQQALTPLSVGRLRLARLHRSDFGLLLFAQELLALLEAGLALVEALDTLVEKETQTARRAVVKRLAHDLRDGLRLSDALRHQPGVFPALFRGLMASAEDTSDLPRSLDRYIRYETRMNAARHRVISAAVYPTILLGVGGAVAWFLLGYVVPRFAQVYADSGRALPWGSQLLMTWGQWAGTHTAALWVGLGLSLAAVAWAARHVQREGPWRLLRALPGARRPIETLALARLYLTLGLLLEGGMPVTSAIDLCHAVVDDDIAPRLRQVGQVVSAGQPLSEALQQQRLDTPVAQRLVRVGERSGQLGAMLARAATFHDEEAARWIERFTRAFEPTLMAAIGLAIGLIVILLYMPIFELAGSLQ